MKIYLNNLLFIIIVLLSTSSCNTNQKKKKNAIETLTKKAIVNTSAKTRADSDSIENVVMNQIEKLPEFKELSRRFDKINKDTSHHLAVIVWEWPSKEVKYYSVDVGDNGPLRFYTYASFYIDPKNLSVRYYDKDADSLMTIEQWRKNKLKDRIDL